MVDFSKNLYKTIASQIYRHHKNRVVVILVLNGYAVGPHYTFQVGKIFQNTESLVKTPSI